MKTAEDEKNAVDGKPEKPRVVLLRVGIDKGAGGILGPLFDGDLDGGLFEFLPIPGDRDSEERTYGNTDGLIARKLVEYFPSGRRTKMANVPLHFDPEFTTFTYGDPTRPKQSLKGLCSGDFLVFYAGLCGWGKCNTPAGLFIVGYFVVEHAGTYSELKSKGVLESFSRNWHILNKETPERLAKLVLVKGGRGSRLLKRALRISSKVRGTDRAGQPVFVLDPSMTAHFGTFTKLNAIQRSTPRWVKTAFCETAKTFLLKLE